MLKQIQEERNINKEDIVSALQEALLLAARKRFPDKETVEVKLSEEGEAQIYDQGIDITPSDFGRLAAQTAKQVILQRIREAEKDGIFKEYQEKVGQLINGTVQRREPYGYMINIGRIETFLSFEEAIPGEIFKPHERVRVIILDVKKSPKGPVVIVSRAHPNFIKLLFEMEVPEIQDKILEIKGIAREPGRRTKIALVSSDPNVGVVGTCVGQMGGRIQNITREINGERIDIIEWSDNPKKFISSALSPAKSVGIEINEEAKSARVIFDPSELSLAIGKEGQNVRLAARLTGYRIDIISKEESKKEEIKKDGEKSTDKENA